MKDYFLYEWREKHQVEYCPCGKMPTITRFSDGSARLNCPDFFIMKCTKISISEGDSVSEAIRIWNDNVDDYRSWKEKRKVEVQG